MLHTCIMIPEIIIIIIIIKQEKQNAGRGILNYVP